MNIIEKKLIDAYVVLVLADRYILREDDRVSANKLIVPEKFVNEVEIRVAERTIEVLSQ